MVDLNYEGLCEVELVNGEKRDIAVKRTIFDGQGHIIMLELHNRANYNFNNIVWIRKKAENGR